MSLSPEQKEELDFRAKFLSFIDRFYSERLTLGATGVAIFALVVALILYAVMSLIDVFNIGMSQRDQVLHIAIPMFAALALIPVALQNIVGAFGVGSAVAVE